MRGQVCFWGRIMENSGVCRGSSSLQAPTAASPLGLSRLGYILQSLSGKFSVMRWSP